jgi:arylsulfatase A-like enzyme
MIPLPSKPVQWLLSGLLFLSALTVHGRERPNILLIMADDQGWGDTELVGNAVIDTPNLNTIAAQGVSFQQFFVSPMCAPTRSSIMTGRYEIRNGVSWVCRRTEYLDLREMTLAELLKAEGYRTGLFGKWHLGEYGPYHPNERGFDEFFGFLDGSRAHYYQTDLDHNGKKFKSTGYLTDLLTEQAMGFIRSHREQPFFCFLSYQVPHHPYQAPEALFKKYQKRGVQHEPTASVYGMIDNMDWNIGRVLELLEILGLDDDTIILFMSDNGPAFARENDGLAGIKAGVGEGSVKSPLFVMWKNHFDAGRKIYDLAAHIDILPTLLELVGGEVPQQLEIDGLSLAPVLRGSPKPELNGRSVYFHQTHFGSMDQTYLGLRTDRYRLQKWRRDWELYDMWKDPSQKRDLASERPELLQGLLQQYEEWFQDVTPPGGLKKPDVPVGHVRYPVTTIIAPDAEIVGGLKYSQRWGWHPDWITNWKSTDDAMIWELDVLVSGRYQFEAEYNCEPGNVGVVYELSDGWNAIQTKVTEPFVSDLLDLPNNVENKHSPMVRLWKSLGLGTMDLEAGRHRLVLRAVEIPGVAACDIKSMTVTRLDL